MQKWSQWKEPTNYNIFVQVLYLKLLDLDWASVLKCEESTPIYFQF